MADQEIKDLIRARGRVQASLTRIQTFVQQYDESQDVLNIKLRMERLQEIWKKYEEIQDRLEVIDCDFSKHDEFRNDFETKFYDLNVKMQRVIDKHDANSSEQIQPTDVSERGSSDLHNNLKLPAIKLPIFSGQYDRWISFSDMFKAMIHANDSLPEIQKFHYLKSSLTGEAERLVSNLPMTANNYTIAWKLLVERYENKRLIAASHIRQLLGLKQLHKESASEFADLVNTISNNVNALQALNIQASLSDVIISQIIKEKLDSTTRKAWELKLNDLPFPPLKEFITFLEGRRRALESLNPGKVNSPADTRSADCKGDKHVKDRRNTNTFISTATYKCPMCKGAHALYKCDKFCNLRLHDRRALVTRYNLCFNCMQEGHRARECTNPHHCKQCKKNHHTHLHQNRGEQMSRAPAIEAHSTTSEETSSSPTESRQGSYCSFKEQRASQVLLATATIKVTDSQGIQQLCRVLLDGGSQSSYITEALAQRLQLKRRRNEMPITGINNTCSAATHSMDIRFSSKDNKYSNVVTCFILPNLTGNMPSSVIDVTTLKLPKDITLADDEFNIPGRIDMLIGSDLYPYIMKNGRYTYGKNHPVIQETQLGWILLGRIPKKGADRSTTLFICNESPIDFKLQRFWEQEEIVLPIRTKEEEAVERHFVETTTRDETGRFIVRLPRHSQNLELGDSYTMAEHRFQQLERKLTRNLELRREYTKFMDEYLSLGHMQPVSEEDDSSCDNASNKPIFFLPHHAVFKESSTTTKTRVVFDASAKGTTGVSLNDMLMVGPTIQQDLISIVLRFRMHTYAMTADISKMYRQIRVHPEDYNLQRLLWRRSSDEPLKQYQLVTITYGTSPASFLATRCLNQLASEEASSYPLAAEVISRDMYVDDLVTGSDNLSEARRLQEQIIYILGKGGFTLHKWCANHADLLEGIPEHLRESELSCKFKDYEGIKTLGLVWHPSQDTFKYEINIKPCQEAVTKRVVLSIISSIFDPTGLLGPATVRYKILIQRLWLRQIGWDEELPHDLKETWKRLYRQLPALNSISIPRLIKINGEITTIQIHGFSDASERAFGACVYIRSGNANGKLRSQLLCSKSRVAPVKQVSIPRLELCGAQLLARLLKKVLPILCIPIDSVHLWTDSRLVLTWLQDIPTRWNTYVANRVSEIQDITLNFFWHHVPSVDNPADILSRGISPEELWHSSQWWNGPAWLEQGEDSWPHSNIVMEETPLEQRKHNSCMVNMNGFEEISRFSSLKRLERVIAYCRRFIDNARNPKNKKCGSLTVDETEESLLRCIRKTQELSYPDELRDLRAGRPVRKNSKLLTLHPFLDKDGLIRVGGRLQAAALDYDQKHQMILPSKCHLSELIVQHEHARLLHGGPQLMHSSLRQRFWITKGMILCKKTVHSCVKCFRMQATPASQLMGNLPSHRLKPARPFFNCGVDYAGPFLIRQGGKRSKTKVKCYAALFICLVTRAIHIELVSDLTTESFLAALRRFMARRGRSHNIYSDNATCFKGANNALCELRRMFSSDTFQREISDFMTTEGVRWHFIPPDSPHFGGLWEAGIRSMKHHMRRVIGNACITFEEMSTILTQIEACLNSRPMCQIPSDPNDPQTLTPGHFLVGGPLTALPDADYSDVPMNKLSRWQFVQRCTQQLWKKWSRDYLHQLQQRHKWSKESNDIQRGAVVLMKDDHIPPLQWKLGVIEDVHYGSDELVRVADVRTQTGVFRRAIHKLCPLPGDTE